MLNHPSLFRRIPLFVAACLVSTNRSRAIWGMLQFQHSVRDRLVEVDRYKEKELDKLDHRLLPIQIQSIPPR